MNIITNVADAFFFVHSFVFLWFVFFFCVIAFGVFFYLFLSLTLEVLASPKYVPANDDIIHFNFPFGITWIFIGLSPIFFNFFNWKNQKGEFPFGAELRIWIFVPISWHSLLSSENFFFFFSFFVIHFGWRHITKRAQCTQPLKWIKICKFISLFFPAYRRKMGAPTKSPKRKIISIEQRNISASSDEKSRCKLKTKDETTKYMYKIVRNFFFLKFSLVRLFYHQRDSKLVMRRNRRFVLDLLNG